MNTKCKCGAKRIENTAFWSCGSSDISHSKRCVDRQLEQLKDQLATMIAASHERKERDD